MGTEPVEESTGRKSGFRLRWAGNRLHKNWQYINRDPTSRRETAESPFRWWEESASDSTYALRPFIAFFERKQLTEAMKSTKPNTMRLIRTDGSS